MELSLDTEPLLDPKKTISDVNNDVCKPLESFPGKAWFIAFGASLSCLLLGVCLVTYQFKKGIGVLGINRPVGWGVYITNFVFWIGIGHAGTLISAILFLFRQKWRTSINRSAEAMTIFAVMTAGVFPLIHTGRPWLAFWLFPYPNDRGSLWVNFRSPLLWDVFAVSTYFTISLVFWYIGLIPDFASIRDRAKNKIRKAIYTVLSFGWQGKQSQWNHYEVAYLILAGLSTPLVLSVHSIVSFDFAVSLLPGWHTTIFPPYFVAGAIFSGFAMVLTLLVIVRKVFQLEGYITMVHLENMNKIILATCLMVGYAYACEFFIAWYSGSLYEMFTFKMRATGPFAWAYWTMVCSNVLVPQLFWFKKFRRSIPVMFVISLIINIGMWFERFTIIVTSLSQDYLPSSWHDYWPTAVDWGVTLGSFGLFFTLFLLFCRVFPVIAMSEVKSTMHTGKKTPETEEFVF
ncbi:MAG: NrfD/PsrC family molybdoenzyme membrane anchor subunit [Deltaproteobacteria bacterium]|nr:NrfD/PsrC family molybdoenzyme membrane anchor subunit [Deltaproteobacteria bacterium]